MVGAGFKAPQVAQVKSLCEESNKYREVYVRFAAHIMDGPRGPIGKVKAGAIRLALEADAVIVPFYVSVDLALFFNSWDKFFIPKPFSKVKLRFDTIIRLKNLPMKRSLKR